MATEYVNARTTRPRGWGNVGQQERMASIGAGVGLVLAGWWLKGRTGRTLATTGTGLALRGAVGWCPVYAAAGVNRRETETRRALGGRRGVTVDESVSIKRDAPDVYAYWRRLENLPRLMPHLESVEQIDATRSHWVACGPLGMSVEWDAEIINEIPNRLIAWRSLEGADLVSAGSVTFHQTPTGTDVKVRLQYSPASGKAGATLAWLIGEAPGQELREGLARLREDMERSAPEYADA